MNIEQALGLVLGKPYSDPGRPPESFSCLQLVEWLRTQCGLATPLIDYGQSWGLLAPDEQKAILDRTKEYGNWQQVGAPALGDVVLCSARQGLPSYHAGLWTPDGVVHAYASVLTGRGTVVRSREPAFRALYSSIEFWRCG